MKMTLKAALSVPDHSSIGQALITHLVIQPGIYEVERITNPWPGRGNDLFIAIAGTKIGAGQLYLLSFSEGGDNQITFDPPMVGSLGSGSPRDQIILVEINDKLSVLEKLVPGLSITEGNTSNLDTLRSRLVAIAERVGR